MRATQLQELIFKNGQAGITKAAVSIVFDNTDPSNCPNGYEGCREITVTRIIAVGGGAKNKHLINGKHPKSAKAVADLFGSIQMNVNNANFLIMQGEITKMLNMKPAEVRLKAPKKKFIFQFPSNGFFFFFHCIDFVEDRRGLGYQFVRDQT